MNEHDCQVCGMPDSKKPMCYRGTDWCCENHRKMIAGELSPEAATELFLQAPKAQTP